MALTKTLCTVIFLFATSFPLYATASAAAVVTNAAAAAAAKKKAEDKIIAKDMALRKNAQFHHDKNMRNHNFSGAKLRYALFNKVDLSGADFSGADLRNATFIDVDLSNTDFRYSNMLGARMIRVKINNDTMLPDLNYPETNIK